MGVNGIYGLSGSGLDIESMVKVGMMSRQNQYDKMYKKETKVQWQKEAYADVYSTLTTFNLSTLSDYKMQSKMNAMSAVSSDTGTVSVSANGAAVAMSHKVTVNSLSSNAYLLSAEPITRENTDAEGSIYLKDSMFKSISKVGDNQYEITTTDDDGNEVTRTVSGDDTAFKITLQDDDTDLSSLSNSEKEALTISYSFADLADGKTFNDLAADIRSKGTNIQATYDAANDVFSLYNSEGGSDNKIKLTLADGADGGTYAAKLLNNMHLAQSANGELEKDADGNVVEKSFSAGNATTTSGDNGSVTIDGREYTNITNNRITVSGVTYNLLNTNVGSTTTVTVTQDTDAIIDRVKQFVEDYNKILDGLQDKYHETIYGDYDPLSKTQENGMTKEQIEKWNEKAKSGLLNHDSIIGDIISKMREALSTPVDSVDSKYNSAYALGISTSTDRGHITLNEEKLKKALSEDLDSVYQVFGNLDANDDYASNGVAQRLSDVMVAGTKKIKSYAGTSTEASDSSTLGNKILEWQNKMSDFKIKMDAYETLLYKKYDAMESALQMLSVQLNYITGGQ